MIVKEIQFIISKFLHWVISWKTTVIIETQPNITVGKNFRIGNFSNFIVKKTGELCIDENVDFRNSINIFIEDNAILKIASNVFMNNNCSINCLKSISIGENTLFGENVKLYDHNHSYVKYPNFKVEHQKFNCSPIVIGNNCWLGSNVTVLKGVTIGNNVIIGAGCTIYKDIPDNMMVINKQELVFKQIK